ncbi:unnamed protein product [Mycena citricolor]|uniref:DUF4211 domain-containing protein n=1 Tax=Mycena citricolor TaxID=2018698 RepID=A0AAD2HRB6_9AGAR|nr:unnamed protein product [Mycena citricolor]
MSRALHRHSRPLTRTPHSMPLKTKRKRDTEDLGANKLNCMSPPVKQSSRRATNASNETIKRPTKSKKSAPIAILSDVEPPLEIPVKKRKKTADDTVSQTKKGRKGKGVSDVVKIVSDSDEQSVASPQSKKKQKNRESKPKAQEKVEEEVKVVDIESDSEQENVSVPPRKRKRNPPPTVAVLNDSEEDEVSKPRRLRRKKSPLVESSSDEDGGTAESPPRQRLRRHRDPSPSGGEDEDSGVERSTPAKLYQLDSGDEDLEAPQMPSSKPTRRDKMQNALARYNHRRKNRSSPAPSSDAGYDDRIGKPTAGASLSDLEEDASEEDGDDVGVEPDLDDVGEDTFVVDDDEEADSDANAVLDRMRYSHREINEHFEVFVEYMVALHSSDEDYIDSLTEDEKEYFSTAVNALKRHIDPLADSMVHSTWKAPFIATMNLRPILSLGTMEDSSSNCHACWTRGRYACDLSCSYLISTTKGIYDHETFKKKKEKGLRYGKKTQFENNAEAPNLPYPPDFELTIGKRCFNRAVAYHEARHYLFSLAEQIRKDADAASEENPELRKDPNALFEALKEGNYIEGTLLAAFKDAKKGWAHWTNRKDQDLLG